MMKDFRNYAELAEQHLFKLPEKTGGKEHRAAIAHGQAWATLALAAAMHELAEAQRES